MADDQGARPDPEIPLPIRVIRSGKIVYQVGSLADLVTLAAADKLSTIDEIDGLQPGNPIDLYAVPEIARALAERQEYWLRRNGRALTIGAMFFGLPFLIFIGSSVRKWWADGMENGEFQVLLFIIVVLVMNLVVPLVQTVRRRQRLQQLGRSDALVEAAPGRDDRLLATHLGGENHRVRWTMIGSMLALLGPSLVGLAIGNERLVELFAKVNERIFAGEIWRLVTPIFLHANFMHLGMNVLLFTILGLQVANLFGPGRMVLLFLGCGVAGSVASLVAEPRPSIGASGGVLGLAGVLLATGIRAWGRLPPVVRRHLTTGIGLTVVINLALGFFIPNIDNACHIGGLAAGLVMGSLLPFSPTTEKFLRPADRKQTVPS
ncbi:MAG: hypothetical protein RLZZ326_2314 [Planctomycetota bacterium]|jgi:rhomboid protease GluP